MAKSKDFIGPLVVVWKTSTRPNATTKIKKTSNYHIDFFLKVENTIPGIPLDAIILEIGLGNNLYKNWCQKYKISG